MKQPFHTFVRRVGTACAALGFSLSAAFADEPGAFPADYGYALTGLGTGGDEVALVFTNTAYTAESPMEWTLPDGAKSIWYLVVGGGGSGGSSYANSNAGGGGGGAGGFVEKAECLVDSAAVSVSIGAGGPAVAATGNSESSRPSGKNGGDSVLTIGSLVVTAHGGGGGGGGNRAGNKGGSGGGGGATTTGVGGACYDGEGNAGGDGKGASTRRGGGGGGGAGAAGSSAESAAGAKGGDGKVSAIGGGYVSLYKDKDGNEYYCAGGGGGSAYTSNGGAGGVGGGGKGNVYSKSATVSGSGSNYGCGGGGTQGNQWASHTSGAGYQGIVIVRYRVLAGNEAMVPTVASKPYNGETQTADVTDGEGYYVAANAGGVDAGDYVVTLALSNGWHWTGGSTDPTNLAFMITKATDNAWTNYPSITPKTWGYYDAPGVVTNGLAKYGTSVVTYDGGESEMPTDIGEHTAHFTVAETANFTGLSKDIVYTVAKSANGWLTEPALSKATWEFGQPAAVIVTNGMPKYGEVGEIFYDGDPSLTEMPTNVAAHKVAFVVAEGATYFALTNEIAYTVIKKVNAWTTDPVVPTSYNIEDPVPAFADPAPAHGEVYRYFDGDVEKTEPPTDLGSHTVTYKVDEGDVYQGYEQTYAFKVTYKPITDWKDASKVYGYRLPKLGVNQNEVALVFTNTAYTAANPMNYRLPQYVNEVSYLVVGGGASGGASGNAYGGGGGGAGGVTNETGYAVVAGAALQIYVGAGGAAVAKTGGQGRDGGNSMLSIDGEKFMALRGGGGGAGSSAGTGGNTYGCGGGAGGGYDSAGTKKGGAGVVSNGGDAKGQIGAGGGGAGGDGGAAVGTGGPGGAGVGTTIFNDTEMRIAGGGSGSPASRINGPSTDGGGKGTFYDTQGVIATGGSTWGAGGGGSRGGGSPSGAGYQGVVVVRYAEDPLAVTVPYIAPKAYTGETLTADVPADYRYTVTANEGGTDVGEYSVTLTLDDNYAYFWDGGTSDPTNLVFEITQAQNEWTVEPSISKDYWLTTDEPGVLTNGVTRFGEVTRVIVKDGGAAEPFTGLPTAAGVYVITNIAPAATENYLAPDVTEKTVTFTIFNASETPDFTVAFNGAVAVGEAEGVVTAAVPYRVSCEVETVKKADVCALVALEGADETNEVTLAKGVALDAAGFGLLEDLVPGTNYWVALYGKGVDDEKSSPTTDVVRVTVPGPATGLTASATFTNDPKEFVIAGSVTPGLGTTTVYLRWSLNSKDLDQLATYTFAYGESGAFATNIAYEAFSDWLYWDVAVSNTYAWTHGDLAWSDAKAAKTVTRADSVATAYTWNGNGGDNRWANVANWQPSRTPCYGIPDGANATANVWGTRTLDLGGQSLTVAAFNFSANQTLTLTNGTLTLPVKQVKTNCRLCLKDGGAIKTGTEDCVFAQNGYNGVLELAGGATVNGDVNTYTYDTEDHQKTGNTILVHGENNAITGNAMNQAGRLFVDVRDGSLTVGGLNVWRGGAYPLELAVSNATVTVGAFGINHAASQTANRRKFDVFIPANGLAEAPITVETAYDLTEAAYFALTCDEAFSGGKVPLVKGIKSIPAAATLVAHTTCSKKFSSVEYTLEDGVLYVRLKKGGAIIYVK